MQQCALTFLPLSETNAQEMDLSEENCISERELNNAIQNKSCIRVLIKRDEGLISLPAQILVSYGLQKINLSQNQISSFEDLFRFHSSTLKELILSSNEIAQVPAEAINSSPTLKVLRLAYNRISVVPALLHVHQIELHSNPVRLCSKDLANATGIRTITMDWIPYLIPAKSNSSASKLRLRSEDFLELVRSCQTIDETRFIDFGTLFKMKKLEPHQLSKLIVKAINSREKSFFLSYLHDHEPNLSYYSLSYKNKQLLEFALERNCLEALLLFTLNTEQVRLDPDTFFKAVKIACFHSNLTLFMHLYSIKPLRSHLQLNAEELVLSVIRRWNSRKQSLKILKKIMRLVRRPVMTVRVPSFLSQEDGEYLSHFIHEILEGADPIWQRFRPFPHELELVHDFSQQLIVKDREPIIHLFCRFWNDKALLAALRCGYNPFVKNYRGLRADQLERCSDSSKKILNQAQHKLVDQPPPIRKDQWPNQSHFPAKLDKKMQKDVSPQQINLDSGSSILEQYENFHEQLLRAALVEDNSEATNEESIAVLIAGLQSSKGWCCSSLL